MDRSKKTVKKHVSRLVRSWRLANELAWSTVGAPGPVFTNTTPGPDKDRAWEEHHDLMSSYQNDAATMCRQALYAAPAWLRWNKTLVEKAFDKAFTCNGCAAWGPGIPSLPAMMSGSGMNPSQFKEAQLSLGLTSEQISKLLRVSVRTVEKWRQGSREVPGPAIVVLRLCLRYKSAVAWLLNET